MIVLFPGTAHATRSEVGGKAASLMRMTEAGLPVPPGAVLTTAFFAPWFNAVTASVSWTGLTEAPPAEWAGLCRDLKRDAQSLELTADQENTLDRLRQNLAEVDDEVRFAVRSSSPDEDLTSASFAGSYETRLGVHPNDLEGAVRHCFVSSLDVRVLSYKQEHGFDVWSPSIAVIVQRQIDSEISGVGFSLNPVTNDYDEAVIDANWGLGTSVVEGRITPDHFVVDKVEGQVVEAALGSKQVSVWLDADGGTVERPNDQASERTLTDTQLRELNDVICRVEALYQTPIDIEWAYAGGSLYMLQARPVTTYVPLPPEMVTAPNERRRLYADAALSKGLTSNAPISPLGLDNMNRSFSAILTARVGASGLDLPPKDALFFFAGGRMYVNYSNLLWLASPRMLAKSSEPTDALMAEILAAVDSKRYRAAKRPPWVSFRLFWLIPRIVWRLRRFFWNVLRALLTPDRAYRAFRDSIEGLESDLLEQLDGGLPLAEFRRTYEARMAGQVFDDMMPVLLAGMMSPGPAVWWKDAETKALAERLKFGNADNVVVEMGIALYSLTRFLDRSEFDDLDRLAEKVEQRKLAPSFLQAWDDFLANFGWRGPLEMDLASPRYADDPLLALRQMSYMAAGEAGFDPNAAHQRLVAERQDAYDRLIQRLGPLRRAMLRWIYRRIDRFAGTRDTPKHLLTLFGYVLRRRALAEGRRFVQAGRLATAEEVFDLRFEDLELAARDPSLDLRVLRMDRTRFQAKLKAHVTEFPAVIDSRGRILRPPPTEAEPGMLSGMPVSPGVITGPVKILHRPDEKPVEKGDVLVAYTTDPGWTPLFVNAAAVVLEVGGVLQHGAVVAREYGKPCVVGIDRVVAKLRDGETVEVNGTTGTVRLVSQIQGE